MALSQIIEKSTHYLQEANNMLAQIPSLDLSVIEPFIDMDEFGKVYDEIKTFIMGIIEDLKRIIDNVINAIRIAADEILQLNAIKNFITLLFNTAKNIGAAFGSQSIVNSENPGTAPMEPFMKAMETAKGFVDGIFSEFPGSGLMNALIGQLEILKIRLTNLSF